MRNQRLHVPAALSVLFCSSLLTSALAWATYNEEVPVPQDERTFVVDEDQIQFEALEGATAYSGVLNGAGYRIEVPDNWEGGDLLMWAHGFRGTGEALTVDSPPMRAWLIENGIAWAASSYSKNYYDVRVGVQDTNDLARFFADTIGDPARTFISGASMGGHITGAAIEQFPNIRCPKGRFGRICRRVADILGKLSGGVGYSGAAPYCGVMGDVELINYFSDFNRGAEAITGVGITELPPPPDYYDSIFPGVVAGLTDPANAAKHFALTEMISGGPRPGFPVAFSFWRDFLFGFAGSDTDFDGIVSGNLYDNIGKVYQLDTDPALTADEQQLNEAFIRVVREDSVNPKQFLKLQRVPEIHGRLAIPVVSTHTLGDLFVPFSMQTIYAQEAMDRGRSQYLVSRATRAIGHCQFSLDEWETGVADMIDWADGGPRPDGDDILDVEALADPSTGCDHTQGEVFGFPPRDFLGAFPSCDTLP